MSIDLQIPYTIQFLSGNFIRGRIFCKSGDLIDSLKRKIIEFEGLKNEASFILTNTALTPDQQVSSLTKEINLRENEVKNLGSVVSIKSRKMSDQNFFEEESIIFDENSPKNFIETQPEIPPIVCGNVTFPNSFFFCFSSRKYLVLDTQNLRFYDDDRSQVLFRQVKPKQIQEIKSYKRKHFYCIRLILRDQQINMKFINKDVCKQWVGYLNQVLNFSLYLEERQAFSQKSTFQKYLDTQIKSKCSLGSTNIVKLKDESETVILSVHPKIPCQNSIKKKFKKIIKFSSFQITHKIDSGSFSIIYLAKKDGINMALKQIKKDKLLSKGQMKYALTQLNVLMKSKSCPYIIPLYYAFQTHQYIYLALKYIPSGNLGSLIQKRGKLSENQAVQIIIELIVAIQFLHDQKILYRDLKPDNILIGSDGHIYLTDFGLAKQLEEEEQAHSFLGTPLYLAPERFINNGRGIDYLSDIYATGIIFFEMLHGYNPFSADNFNSVAYNIRNIQIEIDQNLSPLVKKFLEQTLQKNPQKRLARMSHHPLFKNTKWTKIKQKKQEGIQIIKENSNPKIQINYQIDQDYNESTYPDKKIADWNYNYKQVK